MTFLLNLNKSLVRITAGQSKLDLSQPETRDRLLVRGLVTNLYHLSLTLGRERGVEITFQGSRSLESLQRVRVFADYVGEDHLFDLNLFLTTLRMNGVRLVPQPVHFTLEAFDKTSKQCLAGRAVAALDLSARDRLVAQILVQIAEPSLVQPVRTREELLAKLRAQAALLQALLDSPESRAYRGAAALMAPPQAVQASAGQVRNQILDQFEKEVVGVTRRARRALAQEIVAAASFERGLAQWGESSLAGLVRRYPNISSTEVLWVSLLDAAPPDDTELGRITFTDARYRTLPTAPMARQRTIRIPFIQELKDNLGQLILTLKADDRGDYEELLNEARLAVSGEIKYYRHYSSGFPLRVDLLRFREVVSGELSDRERSVFADYNLFKGLELLVAVSERGIDVPRCFVQKLFWDGMTQTPLELVEMVELFGMIEEIPEHLLTERPMMCHVFFTESALLLCDVGSRRVVATRYDKEFRHKVMARLHSILHDFVRTQQVAEIPPELLNDLDVAFQERCEREWNPGNVTPMDQLIRSLQSRFGIHLPFPSVFNWTVRELETLMDYLAFFPPHLLRFIRRLEKTIKPRSYLETTEILPAPDLLLHFREPDILFVPAYEVGILATRSSAVRAAASPLYRTNLARLIWHHGLSARQRARFIELIGRNGVSDEGAFGSRFSTDWVRFLEDSGMAAYSLSHEEMCFFRELTQTTLSLPPPAERDE